MPKFDIIIDTNVVMAGLRSGRGASNELLHRLKDPSLTVHVSNTLLFEYEDVLRREQAILGLANPQIDNLLDGFCELAEKHYISFFWRACQAIPPKIFWWTWLWRRARCI